MRRSHCRSYSHAKLKIAQAIRSKKPHLKGTVPWVGVNLTGFVFNKYRIYTKYIQYQLKDELGDGSAYRKHWVRRDLRTWEPSGFARNSNARNGRAQAGSRDKYRSDYFWNSINRAVFSGASTKSTELEEAGIEATLSNRSSNRGCSMVWLVW